MTNSVNVLKGGERLENSCTTDRCPDCVEVMNGCTVNCSSLFMVACNIGELKGYWPP